MSQGPRAFLHQDASASSLGLARVLVFGIWAYQLAVDPVQRLGELPSSAFDPPGLLRALPDQFWDLLLRPSVLLWLKIGLLVALGLVVVGVPRSRLVLGLTVGGLIAYQSVVRGFSGHMNHAELGLLYISMLFVFFPVFDGLTLGTLRGVRRQPVAGDRGSGDRASYVTAMLAACTILSLTYFFVGAVRLWKGIDLFATPALRDLIADNALQYGRFDGATIVPAALPKAILGLPLWAFQSAFVLATALELSAPLALFSRRLRPWIVLGLLCFHASIWAFMGVPFPENICLLALFSGTWFQRTAARLDRPTTEAGRVSTSS